MGEYISVQEFADLAGVTVGAVYKRISAGDLVEYVVGEKGERTISTDATSLFKPRKDSRVKSDTQSESHRVDDSEMIYNAVNNTLQELMNQLQIKDKQIAELNERLQQALELTRNSQVLLLDKKDAVQIPDDAGQVTDPEPVKRKKSWQFWK